jgi:hypothetical protein
LLDLQKHPAILVIIVAIIGSLLSSIPGFDFASATSEESGSTEGGGENGGEDDGGDQPSSSEQNEESVTQEEDETPDSETQFEDTTRPQDTSSLVASRPIVVEPSFPTPTPTPTPSPTLKAPFPTLIESPPPTGNFCKLFPFHPSCKTPTPTPTIVAPLPTLIESPPPTIPDFCSNTPRPPFCPPTPNPTTAPNPTLVAPNDVSTTSERGLFSGAPTE